MIATVLRSPWLITGIAVSVVVAVVAGFLIADRQSSRAASYCAEFDDATGLFVGNQVTRRGVPIGEITGVDTADGHAVVRFTASNRQKIPADVSAATVAPSVIAVRQLALIGDYTGGPELATDRCIPKIDTNTPASISESMQSLSDVAAQLTTDGGLAESKQVLSAMTRLDDALDGTGPLLNTIIKQLAQPGRTPINGALTDTSRIIDSASSLSTGLASNWGFLESFITEISGVVKPLILPTVDSVAGIIGALPETLNMLSGVIDQYSHFIWPAADVVVPLARLVGNGMRSFGDVLGIVPVLIRAFTVSFDQKNMGLRIRYTPPTTRIPAQNPKATCANINRYAPGQCTVTDPSGMDIDVLTLILTMTGAAR
ncbi:MlaD family protein [Gordonia humi]|uniref:Phospholipid/cholesterol/gamma-HCH transport system substrate-binding protein n=1 Tax=Gordonia humi TaxID=686429 RepID=A0A840F5H6_9ACTN|nr:MlaD family protein [Gordonia humi]MBB4137668.1 phospholipid/cholesterol/gamma-HCH transport system substrate-binding protein [Gordonia humi]